ncbi:MAG: ceramidase domain-containing protein [Pseudomonadota bacterium]
MNDTSSWFEAIDIYCERTDATYWSEPINALSNLAFIIAGLWAFSYARRLGADIFVQGLCLWVAVIGVGSFLFHTHANGWSLQADVIPIQIFIVAYTLFALRRYVALTWLMSIIGTAALVVGLGFVFGQAPQWMYDATNGSLSYAPAFVILFGIGGYLVATDHSAGRGLIAAGGVFVLSLTIRSLDMAVCETLPTGIHMFWHIFNGVLLGILCFTAARHGRPLPAYARA